MSFKIEFSNESSLYLLLTKYLSFKWVSISNLVSIYDLADILRLKEAF